MCWGDVVAFREQRHGFPALSEGDIERNGRDEGEGERAGKRGREGEGASDADVI